MKLWMLFIKMPSQHLNKEKTGSFFTQDDKSKVDFKNLMIAQQKRTFFFYYLCIKRNHMYND